MPCVHPIPAAKSSDGKMVLSHVDVRELLDRADDVLDAVPFLLPCGSCVCCQISRAREWAIRCTLELDRHARASFVTLTYSERYVPPTLSKLHLSRFSRYLRRRVGGFRFFGCGEYGEKGGRPHYHAILFGTEDADAVQESWGRGFATVTPVTPERISYTAGYCAKKLGFHRPKGEEIDYSTGELYTYQPPFLQMSRRPGIAGDAREFFRSWRSHAIWQGRPFPVPRFLHNSFKESASESELAQLELEKIEARAKVTVREFVRHLDASADMAHSRMRLKSERSQL